MSTNVVPFLVKSLLRSWAIDKLEDLVADLIKKGKTKASFSGDKESDLKKIIVDFLNDKIDLPLLNEEQEEKLFYALVSIFMVFVMNKLP